MAEDSRVKVRMYRQGLGDCFLLTFNTGTEKPFRLLIDCGVVLGTPGADTLMERVAADIEDVTQRQIDLLVITHEHWDHLSGFIQAKQFFDRISFGQVWFAWTEDPQDALANKLRSERRTLESGLRLALAHIPPESDEPAGPRVQSLVEFMGARAGSTGAALTYVKEKVPGAIRYCQPGEPPIQIPGLPNIRFWVLGPPKDQALLKKSNPGKGDAYGIDAPSGFLSAFSRMAADQPTGFIGDDSVNDPFDDFYEIPLPRAEQLPFFASRYFADSDLSGVWESAKGADDENATWQLLRSQSWRRIDSTWTGAAETMALQLDSATNNTSLVLALEFVDSGDVLLFPGDAQAGNWMSWQNLRWTLKGSGDNEKEVTAADLLRRTVLYKVGHHGSHNATLRAQGLELMTDNRLMALIPVDHNMAVKKGWGLMPLAALMQSLGDKAHARVLRSDDTAKTAGDLTKRNVDAALKADWGAFVKKVEVTDLYYEVSL